MLINDESYTQEIVKAKKDFWHSDPIERRKMLMPFFWSAIAKQGQLFGNRDYNNNVNVSNIYALSYPGYNEIFTGNTDLTIFSYDKIKNQNITFLEYLNRKKEFKGKVVSFTSWNVFPYIFNEKRSKLLVNSRNNLSESFSIKNKNKEEYDADLRVDSSTFVIAKQFVLNKYPRLVHIGLSGTDAYGHKARYEDYLAQAHLADHIISSLWQMVQSSAFYRDNTTFIITTDHGRGSTKTNWDKHGFFVKGSSQTWMALLGNGVRSLGESKGQIQLYQKQIAGTIGHFFNIRSFNSNTIPLNYFTSIKSLHL